jgi:hypothetical protein
VLEGLNSRGDGNNGGRGEGNSVKRPLNYLFGQGYIRQYHYTERTYPLSAVDLLTKLAAREAVTRA